MDNPTTIIPVNIEDEMRGSYLDYAMSVIIGRALPDVQAKGRALLRQDYRYIFLF